MSVDLKFYKRMKEEFIDQNKLTKFALKYTPRTSAILGAILKDIGSLNCAY